MIGPPVRKLTAEELDDFRGRFGRAVARGQLRWIHPDGKTRRRLPLPWRARTRLTLRRTADCIGIWLCDHGRHDAARKFWQALGMIRG